VRYTGDHFSPERGNLSLDNNVRAWAPAQDKKAH
jgi:hypothetical protein